MRARTAPECQSGIAGLSDPRSFVGAAASQRLEPAAVEHRRPDPLREAWLAAIMSEALRQSRDQRLLRGWRSLVTAVTPWRVAVWAASCPGCSPRWLVQAGRSQLVSRSRRAGWPRPEVAESGVND